jgi:hypothetical protein
MSSKIKDVSEFCKLFRVRIPLEEEFDYYTSVLTQSAEFNYLPSLISEFAEFENSLEGGSVSSHKMGVLSQIKTRLTSVEAFHHFKDFKPGPSGILKNESEKHQGSFLVPVDMVEANYSMFRAFDQRGELPPTWEEFCNDQKVPGILARSNSFRQLVFGTVDPRKLLAMQQFMMEQIFFAIRTNGIPVHHLLNFSGDELLFGLGLTVEESIPDFLLIEDIVDRINSGPWPDIIPDTFGGKIKIRLGVHKLTTLNKGTFVKEMYKADGSTFKPLYKTLVGVPGNQYYLYFKKHILNAKVEDRDLYFYSEQKLAKWVTEGI